MSNFKIKSILKSKFVEFLSPNLIKKSEQIPSIKHKNITFG